MEQIFRNIQAELHNGRDVVLTSIIQSNGSVPRSSGAHMMVSNEMIAGTVGGGIVEYKIQQESKEILDTRINKISYYRLNPNGIEDLGMICGGNVDVLFQFLDHKDAETCKFVDYIVDAYDTQDNVWLIRKVNEGTIQTYIYNDKSGWLGNEVDVEMKGHCILDQDKNTATVVEQVHNGAEVFVFGGGHVAQALVPVLLKAGFSCTVIEDREGIFQEGAFPSEAKLILEQFSTLHVEQIRSCDYVCIISRGHELDFQAANAVLKQKPYYIGMMGSKAKSIRVKQRLEEAGYTDAQIDTIYSPIGLEINAETPEEIAISICAQMIQKRAEGR